MASKWKNSVTGSLCVAGGQFLFATIDAIIKFSKLPEAQCLVARYGIQFMIASICWFFWKPDKYNNWYGDKPYIANIWFRGIFLGLNSICLYYAVIKIPLGDARCIYDQSPVTISIIAWLFLNEKLPKLTPVVMLLGLIGIALITQPVFLCNLVNIFNEKSASEMEPLPIDAVISAFISLFAWSVSAVLVRTVKHAHFLQLEIVSAAQATFIELPLFVVANTFLIHQDIVGELDLNDWIFDTRSIIIIIMLGCFGFAALSLSVIGFQMGDATKVAWLEYSTIIFGFFYQIIIFKDTPNKFQIYGVIFVAVACLSALAEGAYYEYIAKQSESDAVDAVIAVDASHVVPGPDVDDEAVLLLHER